MEENETEMKENRRKAMNRILSGISLYAFGLGVGSFAIGPSLTYNKAYQVDEIDLNQDQRPDLVVKFNNETSTIFIQQEDGTYKRLDKFQKAEKDSIEAKVKGLK